MSDQAQLPDSPLPNLIDAGGKVDQDALRAAVERAGPDDADARRVEFILLRDIKDRLDKYLTSRIPFMSRSQIQRMLDDGAATVNGRPARASTKLRLNDVVSLVLPPPPSGEIEPEDIPIDVLYEDEHLIALNKRPDIIQAQLRRRPRRPAVDRRGAVVEHPLDLAAAHEGDPAGQVLVQPVLDVAEQYEFDAAGVGVVGAGALNGGAQRVLIDLAASVDQVGQRGVGQLCLVAHWPGSGSGSVGSAGSGSG
ncbi:MAG: S4 domain-containing protein, partial [Planctomycetota bacterium]